ncbi:hypothetical protein [Dulcicalothrix desertica]|nr:hypothetical protein [Dulcicalothrix desertica]TWH55250.1 hypothetical protein CAL7102_03373 [Dulcicalothrix desertica PCC 7102]
MTYKIRRAKSHVQVPRDIETNQNWQHQKVIDNLKSKIEKLNLELRCKNYEIQCLKSSINVENKVYNLILLILLNSDNDHELSKSLVELDKVMSDLINDLLDVCHNSKYSAEP